MAEERIRSYPIQLSGKVMGLEYVGLAEIDGFDFLAVQPLAEPVQHGRE